MATPRRVKGARALVTGGASGLGALMATELAIRGAAEITLWDRDQAGMEQVATRLERVGTRVRLAQVDLTDPEQVAEAGARTLANSGGIDICINSAGVVTGRSFTDLTEEQIRTTFEVNALALYRTTRVVLPGMLARDRGLIVTIASAAGLTGVARQTDYSASKFAAVGFTESLRAELRNQRSHVRTLLVCPYFSSTGMFDGVTTKVPGLLPILDPNRLAAQIIDAIESGRQRLIVPRFATTVLLVRALPTPLADLIIDAFGINHTMDGFKGRDQSRT